MVQKRFINNVSLLGNDIKDTVDNEVFSKEISTHALHIHPSKKYYFDLYAIHGRYLDNLKFDFSTLNIYYFNKSLCGHVIVDLRC